MWLIGKKLWNFGVAVLAHVKSQYRKADKKMN